MVALGKNGMPGFELSFDKHDARRVLRTMVRLLETEPKVEGDEDKKVEGDEDKKVEGDEDKEVVTPPADAPPQEGQNP